jgi:isocitrate dehydrogenase (NAD+)
LAYNVTLIPGDGTGPEISEAARRAVDATGVKINWDVQNAGADTAEKNGGNPLPNEVIDSVKRNKVALKGPITTPIGKGFRSVNVGLRQALGLYANVRPAKTHKGVRSKYEGIDLVIVRENTEGMYSGIEFDIGTPQVKQMISFEDRIVDNMCMQLVQKPELYDVAVMPNLYGDILSDLAAGLVGGLGIAPGANIGADGAVFEPIHGSAPKYAGRNKVNPMAMMFAGALMLKHIGEVDAGERLERVLTDTIAEGKQVTYDMKPRPDDPTAIGTSQVGDAVVEKLQEA